MRKKLWLVFFLILGAVAVAAWAGVHARAARQFRAIARSGQARDGGQAVRSARKRLMELGSSRDSTGEVDYQLGICEFYRGHPDLSRAAWIRVPPGGTFWGQGDPAACHAGDDHRTDHRGGADAASGYQSLARRLTHRRCWADCSFFTTSKDGPRMCGGPSSHPGRSRTRRPKWSSIFRVSTMRPLQSR